MPYQTPIPSNDRKRGKEAYISHPPIDPRWPKAKERPSRPGTWEAKGVDEAGKRKSYYAKSEYEASFNAAASMGLTVVKDNTFHTFYVSSYWPSKKITSDNWKTQIRWAYDKFIGQRWGGVDLADITRRDVQLWFNSLVGEVANSSLKRIKIVFSNILNMAVEDDLIQVNPAALVRLPAAEEPDKRALTAVELAQFIEATPSHLLPTIIFCACGMRIGEACAPSRAELQTVYGVRGVKVEYQILQPKGGAVRTTKLKTPQSKRFIPLPAPWLDIIENHPRLTDIYLSENRDGGYLIPSNIQDDFKLIWKRAGIGKVTPHELRHTFISIMENELEAPAPIIAKLAGRKHAGSTAGYSHSTVKQLAKWMDKFVALIEVSTSCTTAVVVQTA